MKALIRKLLLESTEIKNIKYNTVEAKFVELRRKIRFQRLRIIRRSSIYISSKFRWARRKRYATVPEMDYMEKTAQGSNLATSGLNYTKRQGFVKNLELNCRKWD